MITSLDNTRVKNWTKLHNKKYRGEEFLLLDEDMVIQAHKHDLLKTLVYVNDLPFKFSEAFEVNQEVMNKISKKENLKYIGIGKPLILKNEYKERVIILEDLQDPMNVGKIIESAYAFNFDTVLLSEEACDIYNQKCLSAASTAFYNVNIYKGNINNEIKVLKEKGFKIYATGLNDYSIEMYDTLTSDKLAIILGNEGSGVKKQTMALADEVIKIDMHNIDSLNVAMAGAILMYNFKK